MRPPDEKKTTLVSHKSARRSISARDFRLPKPYRKPASPDARRGMSRLRVAMAVFSGLLIAGLIAALALIAHENATAPHPLAVVAAKNEEAPVRPLRGAAGRAGTQPPPALSSHPAAPPAPDSDPAPALPDADTDADASLSVPAADLPEDPDVVLITAILLLTPPAPEAVPACGSPPADHCAAAFAPDP